jgi:tetratricopeptide (TPR) repeat protein
MSLLIKALDKAQAEKAQAKESADNKLTNQAKPRSQSSTKETSATALPAQIPNDAGLSLSPPEENLTTTVADKTNVDDVPKALRGSAADISQKAVLQPVEATPSITTNKKTDAQFDSAEVPAPPSREQAANVFKVKRIEPTHQTAKIAILVGLVAFLIVAAVLYWYQFVFNAPDIIIPPRPAINQEMPEPLPALSIANEETASSVEPMVVEDSTEAFTHLEAVAEPVEAMAREVTQVNRTKSILAPANEVVAAEKTLAPNEVVVEKADNIVFSNAPPRDIGIASDSASIAVTQTKTASGVNPILMRAYEAYIAGNDRQAQQDYTQVLQRYGMNVDAMLGLGAIATRQGRLADANGWYQKVLELEPRNEVAKAGLISIQQNNQTQSSESNIKSMLATAPDDANLYAALGDVYAGQGKWSMAQEAYFDAYRINRSAENAFNLGVSLDQLGKSNLALPYYQEALLNAGQSSVIDTVALEARISSIK